MFFEPKITNILKASWWGLEKSELSWEQNFYSCRCVSCRTISLPGFNGLCRKLAKVPLFELCVWRHQSSYLHILQIIFFQNLMSPEIMLQLFANGKRWYYSFMECYVIHLKRWSGAPLPKKNPGSLPESVSPRGHSTSHEGRLHILLHKMLKVLNILRIFYLLHRLLVQQMALRMSLITMVHG